MGPGEQYGGGAIPAISAPLLGAAGQIYDTSQRSKDVKRQIAAQKAEQELAYQRQVEMWHQQNAYNSPEQQMERFGAAGLNPHLIYGQGSSGQAGTPPAYQPPNIQMQGASPPYGSAVASMLPTLMSVGTWMQNMRLSENKINQSDQLIEFLESKYPHERRKFDQVESLFPYQRQIQGTKAQIAWEELDKITAENRHLYGDDMDSGMRELQRILTAEQGRKVGLEADWLSPTRIFGMVNGVIGKFLRPGRSISNVSKNVSGKGSMGRWSSSRKRWSPSRP